MTHRNNRGGHLQRKRKYNTEKTLSEDASPIEKVFLTFQKELDTRHDKYERLVKKSRDLTIESKRIIFLLHRVSNNQNNEEVLEQAESRLKDLFKNVIHEIALELSKSEVYQYIRAFSPGLQEFVEAVSFYHYLKNGSLIYMKEIQNPDFIEETQKDDTLSSESPILPLSEFLTPTDFVLGIADLTGELMRKCINCVASGDIDEPFKLCEVLQRIHEVFLINSNHSRELKRKLFTLQSSVKKVENACYAIKIRGSEIPKHMLADFFSNDDEYPESSICEE